MAVAALDCAPAAASGSRALQGGRVHHVCTTQDKQHMCFEGKTTRVASRAKHRGRLPTQDAQTTCTQRRLPTRRPSLHPVQPNSLVVQRQPGGCKVLAASGDCYRRPRLSRLLPCHCSNCKPQLALGTPHCHCPCWLLPTLRLDALCLSNVPVSSLT